MLALVCGAAIGLERELSAKPAGLRTIILICLGAELLTEVSILAADLRLNDLVRADPARIAAQIVTGIGFIGAGTILVHRGSVVGLTTAATLWVSAAIGMTIGFRAYVIAIGATALVVVTLVVLGWLEDRLLPGGRTLASVRVTLAGDDANPASIEETMAAAGLDATLLGVERTTTVTQFDYRVLGRASARASVLSELAGKPEVRGIRIE